MRRPVFLVCLLLATAAQAVTIDEFALPPGSRPQDIALGPDGNLWFTLRATDQIGRISPSGSLSTFAVPGAGSAPVGICAGPDGAMWFTQSGSDQVGRIDMSGVVTAEYSLGSGSGAFGIASGSDGNLYVGSSLSGRLYQVTLTGSVITLALSIGPLSGLASPAPGSSDLVAAAVINDAGLVYLDAGAFTFHGRALPVGAGAVDLVAGPDAATWFTLANSNRIGRDDADGVSTFALPNPFATPRGITRGADGNLWFTEYDGNRIGRIDPSGSLIDEFPLPTPGSYPYDIAATPDGDLWFTAEGTHRIGRLRRVGELHDTVVSTLRPLHLRIRVPNTVAHANVDVSVRNADVTPVPEMPGHSIRVAVVNLDCPADLIAAAPDFDPGTPGVQDSTLVAGGARATATLQLTARAPSFTTPRGVAPARCRLRLVATTVSPSGSIDPNPGDNLAELSIDVVDENDF